MTSSTKTLAPELQGIILVLLSSFCFSLLNIASKLLYSSGMQPMTIVFFRSLCVLALVCVPCTILYVKKYRFKFGKINFVKGIIDFLSTPVWILAVSHMHISEAVSITYLTPVLTAILAIIFLKEKLTKIKILVMFISFVGVMVIVNPQVGNFNSHAYYALIACALWASANIITKNLVSASQHPFIIVLFSNLVIFSLATPYFISSPYLPSLREIALCAMMAACASGGYAFLAYAYRLTAVNNLVPYDYFRMVFSSFMGYLVFDQMINLNTILGSIIVFSSSLFLAYHSRKSLMK